MQNFYSIPVSRNPYSYFAYFTCATCKIHDKKSNLNGHALYRIMLTTKMAQLKNRIAVICTLLICTQLYDFRKRTDWLLHYSLYDYYNICVVVIDAVDIDGDDDVVCILTASLYDRMYDEG